MSAAPADAAAPEQMTEIELASISIALKAEDVGSERRKELRAAVSRAWRHQEYLACNHQPYDRPLLQQALGIIQREEARDRDESARLESLRSAEREVAAGERRRARIERWKALPRLAQAYFEAAENDVHDRTMREVLLQLAHAAAGTADPASSRPPSIFEPERQR